MKKALTKSRGVYYYKDDEKIDGVPDAISGDLSNISGNLSNISGNLSGIRGDLTGISGNLSGISGNLDDCELTDEDREKGINIEDLIV